MEAVTLMLESDIWDVEPKSLENNLAEITKMSATLQGSQQTHNHQSYNHGAAERSQQQHERLEEIRVSEQEDTADMLVSDTDGCDEKVEMLQNRLPELENHCKRKNMVYCRRTSDCQLALRRKTFTTARKDHNIRYKLADPATQRFTWKERSCSFTNAKQPEQFTEEDSATRE